LYDVDFSPQMPQMPQIFYDVDIDCIATLNH